MATRQEYEMIVVSEWGATPSDMVRFIPIKNGRAGHGFTTSYANAADILGGDAYAVLCESPAGQPLRVRITVEVLDE